MSIPRQTKRTKRFCEENIIEYSGRMTRAKRRKYDEKIQSMAVYVRLERMTDAFIRENIYTVKDRTRKGLIHFSSKYFIKLYVVASFSANGRIKIDGRKKITKIDNVSSTEVSERIQIDDRKENYEMANISDGKPIDCTGELKADELQIVIPDFVQNEIVWAKIKGSSHWPARISRILTSSNGRIMYEVVWFNDYRRSKIGRLQIHKFLVNLMMKLDLRRLPSRHYMNTTKF